MELLRTSLRPAGRRPTLELLRTSLGTTGWRPLWATLGRRSTSWASAFRRWALRTSSALAALSAGTPARAIRRAFGSTLGRRRAEFLQGQFPVAVLVQRQQCFAGIGDLILVDFAVLVGIQCRDNGGHHADLPASRAAGLSRLAAAAGLRRLRGGGRLRRCGRGGRRGILGQQSAGSGERGEQRVWCECFHWFGFVGVSSVISGRSQKIPGLMPIRERTHVKIVRGKERKIVKQV